MNSIYLEINIAATIGDLVERKKKTTTKTNKQTNKSIESYLINPFSIPSMNKYIGNKLIFERNYNPNWC